MGRDSNRLGVGERHVADHLNSDAAEGDQFRVDDGGKLHPQRLPHAGLPCVQRLADIASDEIDSWPAWQPWTVVVRAKGFHVSRESIDGARTEALLNDVRRTKVFRSRALAAQACSAANQEQRDG